jgi:hypothetical protein
MMVPDMLRQKSLQDPIPVEKKVGIVVYASFSSNIRQHKIGGSWYRVTWAKN